MKLRTIVKIAITSSVVLLCAGFALYSFFRISAAEGKKDFDLYQLVPVSSSAVFETSDVLEFVAEVDQLTCSKNNQYLHVSKLFASLKQYLYTLLEDTPHGLSRQMNQILISFHEPDNDRNQVLYCRLGEGDEEMLAKFVQKYVSSLYPPKTSYYKGEEICIYPMSDGDFLACYLTSDFLALSYQKKLIEGVIDAYKTRKSLARDPSFARIHTQKKGNPATVVYTRLAEMIGWTEFEMKLKDDFIYFSGISQDVDSCFAFVDVLRRQESVKGFPGGMLPSTAFYFSKQGVTDWHSMLSYDNMHRYVSGNVGEEVQSWNKQLSNYLMENAGHDLVTCLFQREDSLLGPGAVLSLSMTDVTEAEKVLRSFSDPRVTFFYTPGKAYPVYKLPQNTLFTQLTSFVEPTMQVYATFYGQHLLLAPDGDSLVRYIRQIEEGNVLDGAVAYKAGMDGLSDSYHFMLMVDFDHVFQQAGNQVHLVPQFFLHNADFFRNFILFAQFTCADGMVYPNLVLKYKSE